MLASFLLNLQLLVVLTSPLFPDQSQCSVRDLGGESVSVSEYQLSVCICEESRHLVTTLVTGAAVVM